MVIPIDYEYNNKDFDHGFIIIIVPFGKSALNNKKKGVGGNCVS